MMILPVYLLLAALLLVGRGANADVNHTETQLSWVLSRGGFFSPKLEIRRIVRDDPKSPSGVFTNEDMSKGETVMVIPHRCLLTSGVPGSEDMCDTVVNLAKQLRLKEESEFWPYVNYMFDPKHKGDLPSTWSDLGKDLIETIVPPHGELFPNVDMTSMNYRDACGFTRDPIVEEAYIHVLRRSWDDIMIPIYDMVNHRNRPWFNVDSNSAHEGKDIRVFATQDIAAGEQLYLSYYECSDCDYAETYVLQHIVRDYGFVEQYPQRWNLFGGSMVFEIDEVPDARDSDEEQQLEIRWLVDRSEDGDVHILNGHLKRLKDMSDDVYFRADRLVSNHERSVALEFYEALITALELVIWSFVDETDSEAYDSLEERPYKVDFDKHVCDFSRTGVDETYKKGDTSESQYQTIYFLESEEHDDACLYIDDHLEACSSLRPHYHEVLVHYAAGFVDNIKRVLFIGGGDNMVVHEVLKYQSLEFVIGLELDQNVVRKSFMHFGSQPHFDDERVQWWFGDGVKSLSLLPRDYFGTFDLVLIDLQNFVVEMIGIMDFALQLVRPDGIIVRNEDYGFGTNFPFAPYMVDLYSDDVHIFCHQGITLGSQTVDFLTHQWKDHKVDTLLFEPLERSHDERRFDLWYNYRKSLGLQGGTCKDPKDLPQQASSLPGVIMIIDAEETSIPLVRTSTVQEGLSNALKKAGLTEISVHTFAAREGDTMVFILREGYVVTRTWPLYKYCAFDVLLWSSFDKQEIARTKLITAVGSKVDGESSSSYRVITAGMFGLGTVAEDMERVGLPPISEQFEKPANPLHGEPVKKSDEDAVLKKSTSLIHENAVVAVLCGEEKGKCDALELLAKGGAAVKKIMPVWACSDLPAVLKDESSSKLASACEDNVLLVLRAMVEEYGMIGGIVFSGEVPRSTGQILHKIFAKARVRAELLEDDLVVLETSLNPAQSSWRRGLLDRFRTDFVKNEPAFVAKILFNDTLELTVFSSGDYQFYAHLVDMVARIEEETGLISNLQYVKNGINSYVAEFKASHVFSHEDYRSDRKQWESQKPLGIQTVSQFGRNDESASSDLSCAGVKDAMLKTLLSMAFSSVDEADIQECSNIGDGCTITFLWSTGNAIALWDGRTRIDVNLFTYHRTQGGHIAFNESFMTKIPDLVALSFDEQPRGTGRVINFLQDIESLPLFWSTVGHDEDDINE